MFRKSHNKEKLSQGNSQLIGKFRSRFYRAVCFDKVGGPDIQIVSNRRVPLFWVEELRIF